MVFTLDALRTENNQNETRVEEKLLVNGDVLRTGVAMEQVRNALVVLPTRLSSSGNLGFFLWWNLSVILRDNGVREKFLGISKHQKHFYYITIFKLSCIILSGAIDIVTVNFNSLIHNLHNYMTLNLWYVIC